MNFLMNELPQIRPVLFVQAANVVSVDVGEVGFRHGSCTCVPSRFLPQSRATQKFCNRDQNLRKRSGHVPPFVTEPVGTSQRCHKRTWSDACLRQCVATCFSWLARLQCNDSRRTGIVLGIMVKAAISLMDPGLVANSIEKLRESMDSTRRISTPAR